MNEHPLFVLLPCHLPSFQHGEPVDLLVLVEYLNR